MATTTSRSKFRNVRTNGFASKKEAKVAQDFQLQEKLGLISDLKYQVKFLLIPAYRENGKVIERECSYVADFVFIENGRTVVVDAKGFRTPEYRLKRKLMLMVHGIRIREI